MKKRLLTGAVILLVTIGFICLRQFSLYFFDAFALVIMYGALFEVTRIQKQLNKDVTIWLLFVVPVLECAIFIFAQGYLIFLLQLALALLIILVSLSKEIMGYSKKRNIAGGKPLENIPDLFGETKNNLMIFAYPILPLSFMFAINHIGFELGYLGIIMIFVVAMMTDTFAYLVGSKFGKKKLIPEVSPKKSVEGFFGGFLGAILGIVILFLIIFYTNWLGIYASTEKGIIVCAFIIIAIIGSYANQLGDLIASAYKRKAGVKDFSNIFPGHGGFMDRVDGLMFVSIVVYLVIALMFV